MMLADFHVHSTFSDGKLAIADVVDLYGRAGFGAIAITDHIAESTTWIGRATAFAGLAVTETNFRKYLEAVEAQAERAWDRYRMVVIPGVELSKNYISNRRSAHILGIGISDWISADPDPLDICQSIRAQGGLAVAAHPVSTRKQEKQTYHLWDRREELRNSFDAWEVASGPHLFPEVLNSDLPMLANSDFHVARQLRAWKTLLECERHPDAILRAVRQQELRFHFYEPPAELIDGRLWQYA